MIVESGRSPLNRLGERRRNRGLDQHVTVSRTTGGEGQSSANYRSRRITGQMVQHPEAQVKLIPVGAKPHVLVITGSEGLLFSNPDNYFKFRCMEHYTIKMYWEDIECELIEAKEYPRILLFVGKQEAQSLPVERFKAGMVDLLAAIVKANPAADLVVQALLPWAKMTDADRVKVGECNRAIVRSMKELAQVKPNVFYITASEMMYFGTRIRDDLFDQENLSVKGATKLRRFWLQQLGYMHRPY